MSESSSVKTHTGLRSFFMLVLIIAVSSLWYASIYGNLGNFHNTLEKEGSFSQPISAFDQNSTLKFEIYADVANFNVDFLSSSSLNIFEADYQYTYIPTDQGNDPVSISITNTTLGDEITFLINIDYEQTHFTDSMYGVDLNLKMNPNFLAYAINSEISLGSFELYAFEKTFTQFDIETTTGYVNVEINQVHFDCDPYVSSTTGSVEMILEDITFENDATFLIETTTGGGDIEWIQTFDLQANINVEIVGNTGGYEIDFEFSFADTRFDVSWEDDVGGTDFIFDDFTEINSQHYQSSNYDNDALHLMTIFVETNVGGSEISIQESN